MEAIGAGASVLAFAGFALEGTKFLYKAASGFKHAPQEVAALVSTVAKLKSTLAQIHSSRALSEPDVDARHMKDLLDACNKDIASFGQDLRRVQSESAESPLLQTWKKLKATLREDQLMRMRSKLDHHCAVLQLEFTRLQSNFTLDCRDGIRRLQDTTTAESLQVSTLVQNVQTITSSINSQGDRIQNLQDTATAGGSRISTLIQDVQSIKSSMESQMQNMTLSTTSTIERHAVVSSSELKTISIAVKALQDQILALPDQVVVAQRGSVLSQEHLGPRPNGPKAIDEDWELSRSLERLSQLSSCDPQTFQDGGADEIMEDLECLLAALSQADKAASPNPLIPEQNEKNPGDAITSREMKRIRGLVCAATAVVVNQGSSRSSVVGSKRIIQQHKVKEIVLQNCTMTVTVNRRRLQWSGSQNTRQPPSSSQYEEEFYATVKAIIGGSQSPSVIVAHMRQIQLQNGSLSLHPVISIGNILPVDSPIFKIVSNGDVDELREFLALGKGTLRDRDFCGTPLLHYAIYYHWGVFDLDMCKFLIEHGADVDEVAMFPSSEGNHGTPFQAATIKYSDVEEGRTALTKLLLATGADPTLGSDSFGHPLSMCGQFKLEAGDALTLIMDNPLPFVDLNEPGSMDLLGFTALLDVAFQVENDDWISIFNQLLTRGADISARDVEGQGCLRLLLDSSDFPDHDSQPIVKPIHQCLALLVGNGADVTNIDDKGISVSAYVYGIYNDEYKCAYAGDLWDAVLSQYGHDIRQLRRGFHRLPFYRYDKKPNDPRKVWRDEQFRYDRLDFELLWEGREIECPYYHDPPVWCPYSTSESGDCPYGETGHICPGPDGTPEQEPCSCICCVPESENDSDYMSESDDEDNEDAYSDEDASENHDYMSEEEDMSGEDEANTSHRRIQEVEEWETDDMYGGDHSTDSEPPPKSPGPTSSTERTSHPHQPIPSHPRRHSF